MHVQLRNSVIPFAVQSYRTVEAARGRIQSSQSVLLPLPHHPEVGVSMTTAYLTGTEIKTRQLLPTWYRTYIITDLKQTKANALQVIEH